VPFPSLPPIWLESRVWLEAAALRRSDVWRGEGVQGGDGRPVLLIPGFLAGDGSLGTMTTWLRRIEYRTKRAGIRANVGCSELICLKLEQRLEEMADRHGQRVAIVGQSRGGIFAKALGARRPDLVSGVVTLGSPLTNQLAVHPIVLAQVGMVAALGTLWMPGLLTAWCLRGECCEPFRRALADPFPDEVGYLSIYSRTDGIVDWRACLDPEADEHVEVKASHIGMSLNAAAFGATAHALESFGRGMTHPGGAVEYAEAA
jgi:pimeloyl-ACP methyl ester carboxylesterase